MKRREELNNAENKININGSTWSSTPTINFEQEGVGVDALIDPLKNNVEAGLVFGQKAITLIALIITIILMLILAGVVISLTLGEKGLFNVAKYAVTKTSEEKAREKLELALADLQAHKYTDEAYDENGYINNYLINKGMKVEENIVTVEGWKFTIDRTVPKIGENTEKEELKRITIVVPYIGTAAFTTKVSYVFNKDEVQTYTYKIDNTEIIAEEEYTTQRNLLPESTHTVQVIAKYKDGTQLESNVVTIKTKPRTYLYNNGDECIDITEGWKTMLVDDGAGAVSIKAPTIANNANEGYLSASLYSDSGYQGGSIGINNKINYKNYRYMTILYKAELTSYGKGTVIQICKNNGEMLPSENWWDYALCYFEAINKKTPFTIDLQQIGDISNLYIYLQSSTGATADLSIYEVYLEK